MNQDLEQILKEREVLMEGHFLLSSGLHSSEYLQCARIFQDPKLAEKVGLRLAERFKDLEIDLVLGPAIGGIIAAFTVGMALEKRVVFTERNDQGQMCLRRGFEVADGERVLVVEDVVTTGGSVEETIEVIAGEGGTVVGVGSVIDRSQGWDYRGLYRSLLRLEVETYNPKECPLCQQGISLIKPGSR